MHSIFDAHNLVSTDTYHIIRQIVELFLYLCTVHAGTYKCTHTSTHICMYLLIDMLAHNIYTCKYTHALLHHTHTHTHENTHTHTHTHTHKCLTQCHLPIWEFAMSTTQHSHRRHGADNCPYRQVVPQANPALHY